MWKTSKRLILFSFLSIALSNAIASVHPVPEAGKPCPDFSLNNLVNSKKSRITLNDFKGKWLMIDFWEVSCTSCVASFPKINHLQTLFRDNMTIVLIGDNEMRFNRNIKTLYLK